MSQKAPSAKRCIKTKLVDENDVRLNLVRKHRAPKGALRPVKAGSNLIDVAGQKAPSAKRCIKTTDHLVSQAANLRVRKHRAPKGALRQDQPVSNLTGCLLSESTERQTVH